MRDSGKTWRLLGGLVALNVALVAVGHALAPGPKAVTLAPDGRARAQIGLVFDVGGRGDKSFNDSAWRGLERAQAELGVQVTTIEPSEGADRESALRQLASRKPDLVVGVGFIFSADLERLARQFPDVRFAGVDYSPPSDAPLPPNLAGLKFREHEGSFVVGAIAGMTSKSHVVGFVGGMKIPLIRKFEAGYAAGVKHVCPDCTVLSAYAGTDPKAFADPTRGQALTLAQIDRGADIVYHASGKTGAGVLSAVKARGKLAIGVDADQFDEAPCCVLTSMIKRVDVAVYDTVKDVIDGTFQGGLHEFGLAEEGVGFVANDDNLTFLPEEIRARARAIAAEIIAGTIEVPSK